MTTKNRRPLMIECCPRLDKKLGKQFIHNEGMIEYGYKSLYITEEVPADQISDLAQDTLRKLKDLEYKNIDISQDIIKTTIEDGVEFVDLQTPYLQEMGQEEYQEYLQEQKVNLEFKNSENISVPTDAYFLNFKGLYQYFANQGWFY